jgi:hypothetical protein
MRAQRHIPDVLPPAAREALDPAGPELRALGPRRLHVLGRHLDGEAVLAVARTGTFIDTGSWFGKGRIWLAFTPTALLLVAAGPRPLCRRIPLAELRKTQYNTVTGELVFVPAELPVQTIALPPVEAARALAQMREDGLC